MPSMYVVPEGDHLTPRSTARRPSRNTGVMPVPSSWRYVAEDQKSSVLTPNSMERKQPTSAVSIEEPRVKRWDGMTQKTQTWDGLRKDPELWFPDGDCNIYLCAPGQSRRGPSFRVDSDTIMASRCGPMLDQYLMPETTVSSKLAGQAEFYSQSSKSGQIDLYIPAPKGLGKNEAFQFHVCTRNFFAWIFSKALVGRHLGGALVDLMERMKQFRPAESHNVDAILRYLEETGYSDFRDSPNHALAGLYFAEQSKIVDLWRDAFVHCVGMDEHLMFSPEFEHINPATKALILRAKLNMEVRMDYAGGSLGSFLEDEMSPERLELPSQASAHLDHFRSFLHSFYVLKYGYWPPAPMTKNNQTFSKTTYRAMYFDFRSLYQHLLDSSSSTSSLDSQPDTTGLNIETSIKSFDSDHQYQTLPHPLPLLPRQLETSPTKKPGHFGAVTNFFFISREEKAERRAATIASLERAVNRKMARESSQPLVRAYIEFERKSITKEEQKISAADARRVRWLLIYGVLQILISVTRIPKEVNDTEGVSYNLCCQTVGTPPWKTAADQQETSLSSPRPALINEDITATQLSHSPNSASSQSSPDSLPPALSEDILDFTDELALLKTTNFDQSLLSLHSPQPQRSSFSEILIPGYGNGKLSEERRRLSPDNALHSSNASEAISTPDLASPASSSEDGNVSPDLDVSQMYERNGVFPRALKINKHDSVGKDLDTGLNGLGDLERMHAELEGYLFS